MWNLSSCGAARSFHGDGLQIMLMWCGGWLWVVNKNGVKENIHEKCKDLFSEKPDVLERNGVQYQGSLDRSLQSSKS